MAGSEEHTPEHLEEVIQQARDAAHRAGVDLSDDGDDSYRRLMLRQGSGLTTYSFHLVGLESAVEATQLERELNSLDGVEAVIVYSTKMAWISALDHISPDEVYGHLKRMGVGGYLTSSSLRRRSARLTVKNPRRRMYRHADAHQRAALEAERRKRGVTPLGWVDRKRRPFESNEVLHTARDLITRARLFIAVLFGGPVVALGLFPGLQFDDWQWMSLALTTVVVSWCAWPFHRAMLGGLRRGMTSLDGASSIAIVLAYFYSLAAMLLGSAGEPSYRSAQVWLARGWADPDIANAIFLDVACGVTILLLFGRLLSRRTQLRSKSMLSILAPSTPRKITVVRRGRQGKVVKKEISTTEIRQGDDVIIPMGQTVPSDGEVISGKAVVDMGPVGGVNRTVEVSVGDKIFAGARNHGQPLKIRVRATGSRTRLAAMHRWVSSAARDENRLAQLANKSASLLVPWVLLLAIVNFMGWWLLDGSIDAAIATSISILAAVAPVALALSAPLALRLGLGRAAANGALLRDTVTIHRLAEVESIIFNRVGTLSRGPMSVIGVTPAAEENTDLILRVAAALSMESEHSVSKAIVRADREARDATSMEDDSIPQWLDTGEVTITKNGTFSGTVDIPVDGKIRHVQARLWRPRDLGEIRNPHLAMAALSGGSPVIVSWKGRDRGVINLMDSFKDDANDAIEMLEDMDIETHMMTRDTYPVARRMADTLGISTVLAGISPDRKAATVRGVHAQGAQVAMVGDKDLLNALEVADVGILMSNGERVDSGSTDVVMMREDVHGIPELINLVRHVRNTVDWNIWLSWAYNTVAVLLAMAGVLNPLAATVTMLLSSSLIEWRSARILHANYLESKLQHTHTWQGWTQRLRLGRERKRREELRSQAAAQAREDNADDRRDEHHADMDSALAATAHTSND